MSGLRARLRSVVRRVAPASTGASSASAESDPVRFEIGAARVPGVQAARGGHLELAWAQLKDVPVSAWTAPSAEAYARAGLAVAPEQARAQLRRLAGDLAVELKPAVWLALLGPVFAHAADHDDAELTRALADRLDSALDGSQAPDPDVVRDRDWLRPWVDADPTAPSAPAVPEGTVSYAILHYDHPTRSDSSANIGDHIQTVASLGHLLRHRHVTFAGPDDLVDLAERLQQRVRPEQVRDDVAARVQLSVVERDATNFQEIPPDTWVIGFGWYMHPLFRVRCDFPFHPNLNPLFVSFHIDERSMLTDDAIAYLREHGPIGCRDWTTVDLLLSAGVPAFFSGCLTTTTRTLFPELPAEEVPGPDAPEGWIDMKVAAPDGAIEYRHRQPEVRGRGLAANTDAAVELLETYRHTHRRLVTPRLHAYLPGRSLGLDVGFSPKTFADPRYRGLYPLDEAGFEEIRTGIDALLEQVLSLALAGAPKAEVYARWQELTADRVAAARARHEAPVPPLMVRSRLVADAAERRLTAPGGVPGDAVHVAVRAGRGQQPQLHVLLDSLATRASRPVHAWVLPPGVVTAEGLDRPGLTVSSVDTSGLGDDVRLPDGGRLGRRDVDLLAGLELIPDAVGRLIVLPVDAVVTGDLVDLAGLDLGSHVLAAPSVRMDKPGRNGVTLLDRRAMRLGDHIDAAAELRRLLGQRHRYGFTSFETDVLVVDLDGWRKTGLTADLLGYAERYGLELRPGLHLALGPDRAELPERWHVVPTRSAVTEPALVHYADAPYPWGEGKAVRGKVWHDARRRATATRP